MSSFKHPYCLMEDKNMIRKRIITKQMCSKRVSFERHLGFRIVPFIIVAALAANRLPGVQADLYEELGPIAMATRHSSELGEYRKQQHAFQEADLFPESYIERGQTSSVTDGNKANPYHEILARQVQQLSPTMPVPYPPNVSYKREEFQLQVPPAVERKRLFRPGADRDYTSFQGPVTHSESRTAPPRDSTYLTTDHMTQRKSVAQHVPLGHPSFVEHPSSTEHVQLPKERVSVSSFPSMKAVSENLGEGVKLNAKQLKKELDDIEWQEEIVYPRPRQVRVNWNSDGFTESPRVVNARSNRRLYAEFRELGDEEEPSTGHKSPSEERQLPGSPAATAANDRLDKIGHPSITHGDHHSQAHRSHSQQPFRIVEEERLRSQYGYTRDAQVSNPEVRYSREDTYSVSRGKSRDDTDTSKDPAFTGEKVYYGRLLSKGKSHDSAEEQSGPAFEPATQYVFRNTDGGSHLKDRELHFSQKNRDHHSREDHDKRNYHHTSVELAKNPGVEYVNEEVPRDQLPHTDDYYNPDDQNDNYRHSNRNHHSSDEHEDSNEYRDARQGVATSNGPHRKYYEKVNHSHDHSRRCSSDQDDDCWSSNSRGRHQRGGTRANDDEVRYYQQSRGKYDTGDDHSRVRELKSDGSKHRSELLKSKKYSVGTAHSSNEFDGAPSDSSSEQDRKTNAAQGKEEYRPEFYTSLEYPKRYRINSKHSSKDDSDTVLRDRPIERRDRLRSVKASRIKSVVHKDYDDKTFATPRRLNRFNIRFEDNPGQEFSFRRSHRRKNAHERVEDTTGEDDENLKTVETHYEA